MQNWCPLGGDRMDAPTAWLDARSVMVDPGRDLFDSSVERQIIDQVVASMLAAPHHTYLLLTTCAKRLLALGNEGLAFPRNLWLGVRVESDDQVWRAEDLLRCNTAQAWVSLTPLRGPVPSLPIEMLGWVVCEEPEPALTDVARGVAERCVEAGVPFYCLSRSADGATRPGQVDGRVWDQTPPGLRL